ncbi:MAG: hypothetical protein DRG82_16095 [Deltaproteobacteria bacterium]|nr:MAG: hypothetical protein DRG82_16095 [Deltaproteobacteria bacterium]
MSVRRTMFFHGAWSFLPCHIHDRVLRAFFYQKPVLWHRAYCIISAGDAPLEVLKRYIKNQGKDCG